MFVGEKGTKWKCQNVGQLKKAIAELPDDMQLECELERAVEVQVFHNMENREERYLDITGDDLDE